MLEIIRFSKIIYGKSQNWVYRGISVIVGVIYFEHLIRLYLLETPAQLSFFEAMYYLQNDRYSILLIEGLPLVISIYLLIKNTTSDKSLILRLGSYRKVFLANIYIIIREAILMIMTFSAISMVLPKLIGLSQGVGNQEIRLQIDLVINMFLFFITLGLLQYLLQILFGNEVSAMIMTAGIMINCVFSNNLLFRNSSFGKALWISNVLIKKDEAAVYWRYWSIWLIVIVLIMMIIIGNGVQINYKQMLMLLPWVIYGIYGFIVKRNLFAEIIMLDYFEQFYSGFQQVDKYLFLYLFYQIPIIYVSHDYAEKSIENVRPQYLIRYTKETKFWKDCFMKIMKYEMYYFLVGAIVGIGISWIETDMKWQWEVVLIAIIQVLLFSVQVMIIILGTLMLQMLSKQPYGVCAVLILIAQLIFIAIIKVPQSYLFFIQGIVLGIWILVFCWINREMDKG